MSAPTFTLDGRDDPVRRGADHPAGRAGRGRLHPAPLLPPGLQAARLLQGVHREGGRPHAASCTTRATAGAVVESDTPEINAERRALVQMLFVEGNHFCPSCEKSGDCKLQATAYDLGVMSPHFDHFYPDRPVDASHPDVLLDFNRCILCSLCVRASRDVDRQERVRALRPGDPHAPHRELAHRAGSPTRTSRRRQGGARVPGGGHPAQAARLRHADRPAGLRPEAHLRAGRRRRPRSRRRSRRELSAMDGPAPRKLKVATTSLAGCFGCHMSILDIDERLFALLEKVEFDRSPITDIKDVGECDLGIIEGGLCNAENVRRAARVPPPLQGARGAGRLRHQRRAAGAAQHLNLPLLPAGGLPQRARRARTASSRTTPSCRCRSTRSTRCTTSCTSTTSSRAARPRPTPSGQFSPSSSPASTPHARPRPHPLRLSPDSHDLRPRDRRTPREAAPHRDRPGLARRGPRQGDDPARRRRQGAPGAPAHRRVPRLRALHPGPPVLGSAGDGAAPVRHLPGEPPSRGLQGDGRRSSARSA